MSSVYAPNTPPLLANSVVKSETQFPSAGSFASSHPSTSHRKKEWGLIDFPRIFMAQINYSPSSVDREFYDDPSNSSFLLVSRAGQQPYAWLLVTLINELISCSPLNWICCFTENPLPLFISLHTYLQILGNTKTIAPTQTEGDYSPISFSSSSSSSSSEKQFLRWLYIVTVAVSIKRHYSAIQWLRQTTPPPPYHLQYTDGPCLFVVRQEKLFLNLSITRDCDSLSQCLEHTPR